MRMHYLQHVPFEDMANIEGWAQDRGYDISRTLLYEDEPLPDMDKFDWVVVMGGPMNIYEHDKYPWLAREKGFIKAAIQGGKIFLGICLGAQLIADVLGGKVRKNSHKEIGWHKVSLAPEASRSKFCELSHPKWWGFPLHGQNLHHRYVM
jgi:GMP synthase-like glutamine amidotransferase